MTNNKQWVTGTVVQLAKLLIVKLKCLMRVCLSPTCFTFNSGSELQSGIAPAFVAIWREPMEE